MVGAAAKERQGGYKFKNAGQAVDNGQTEQSASFAQNYPSAR
jgi:hypothetical protein